MLSLILAFITPTLSLFQAKIPFDANKLYCSEILAILLQNNDSKFTALSPLLAVQSDENCSSQMCYCRINIDAEVVGMFTLSVDQNSRVT